MKNTTTALLFIAATAFALPAFADTAGTPERSRNLAPFAEPIFVREAASLSASQPPDKPDAPIRTIRQTSLKLKNGLTLKFKFDLDSFDRSPQLNRALFQKIFGFDDATTENPDDAILRFIAETKHAYARESAVGVVNEYSFFISAKFAPTTHSHVSVLISRTEYTGGAHGNLTFSCVNFDLNAGTPISGKDVFKEDSASRLTELLKKYDPRKRDEDFAYNRVPGEIPASPRPTENFLLLPDGVLFIYSPYEIDCYAAGTISVFIPREELRNILK